MDFILKKRDKEATRADPPILGQSKTEFVFDLRFAKAAGLTIRDGPAEHAAGLAGQPQQADPV
jgi:hypothetical protein